MKIVTDKLELQFVSADRKIKDILELYNSDYDTSSGLKELENAEKWSKLINEFISSR